MKAATANSFCAVGEIDLSRTPAGAAASTFTVGDGRSGAVPPATEDAAKERSAVPLERAICCVKRNAGVIRSVRRGRNVDREGRLCVRIK